MFNIDCNTEGRIFFSFSGRFISIGVRGLMLGRDSGYPICSLVVTEGVPDRYTLGSWFLKNMHVDVNLENREAAISEAKKENTGKPDIEGSIGNMIPRDVRVSKCDQITFQLF